MLIESFIKSHRPNIDEGDRSHMHWTHGKYGHMALVTKKEFSRGNEKETIERRCSLAVKAPVL